MTFWFITGSQFLYGEETLAKVEKDAKEIAAGLELPFPVEYKLTAKTSREIEDIVKQANFDDDCAGIITFCHTFSPSKMWINGLTRLQKPWLHLHTQTVEETLQVLYEHKLQSVIVEGGRRVLDAFIASGLYDEVRVLRSPRSLGAGLPAPALPPVAPHRLLVV